MTDNKVLEKIISKSHIKNVAHTVAQGMAHTLPFHHRKSVAVCEPGCGAMVKCPNCGKENELVNRYCLYCLAELDRQKNVMQNAKKQEGFIGSGPYDMDGDLGLIESTSEFDNLTVHLGRVPEEAVRYNCASGMIESGNTYGIYSYNNKPIFSKSLKDSWGLFIGEDIYNSED